MAYGFKASVTVDNTKVGGSANHTNFPMLFSGIYDGTGGEPDLRTTANGGNVENTDATGGVTGSLTVPADFGFFSDSDLTTPLDFEIEDYDASTGEIVAWVEIPSLDYNDDTVIYIGYGDSGVTTSQEDVNGTWDSTFVAVYHLNGHFKDSTGNANDGSDNGSAAGSANTNLAAGRDFTRSEGDFIDAPDSASLDISGSALTLSGWYDSPGTGGGGGEHGICSKTFYNVIIDGNNSDKLRIEIETSGYSSVRTVGDASGNHLFHGTYDGSDIRVYIDGSEDNSTSDTGNISTNNDTFRIGLHSVGYFDGDIDEIRVANVTRNAGWILTEYNNQSSPSTFYTVGSEETVGGSAIASERLKVGVGR